jgi:hypothetical protein
MIILVIVIIYFCTGAILVIVVIHFCTGAILVIVIILTTITRIAPVHK